MLKSSWSDPPIFFPTAGCPPECVSLAFVQQDHPPSPPPHLSYGEEYVLKSVCIFPFLRTFRVQDRKKEKRQAREREREREREKAKPRALARSL